MGLSQVLFWDFVVYKFDGMIIIRTQLDEDFFFLLQKLNSFYKEFMLPKLVTNLKLYNLEHLSKWKGGQREFEECASQNLLEVVSLVKVLHNEFLVGTAW